MSDDIFEALFFLFADWRIVVTVLAVVVVLSLTGVIPWGDWL
jgi:hypothetical protein